MDAAEADVTFNRAVLSGGGSRSPHWPQMFADCLGVPITVAKAHETGALDTALGAGVGVGVFINYEAGVDAMVHAGQQLQPEAQLRQHYAQQYQSYLALTELIRDFWHRTK